MLITSQELLFWVLFNGSVWLLVTHFKSLVA